MSSNSMQLGKATISFDHIQGEVLSYHKHSETYVSGSGGGPNNQHVRVSSNEVTQTEFFVKEDNGQEHQLVFRDEKGLVLREGQKITMIRANVEGYAPVWVYVYVHNTDMEFYLNQRIDAYHNKTIWHYPLLAIMILINKYYFDADGWGGPIFWAILASMMIIVLSTSMVLNPIARKVLDKGIDSYAAQILP